MTGPQALTAAHYRRGNDLADCHCSGCAFYAATTKVGEGRCAENEGAAVHFQAVCDRWKPRG